MNQLKERAESVRSRLTGYNEQKDDRSKDIDTIDAEIMNLKRALREMEDKKENLVTARAAYSAKAQECYAELREINAIMERRVNDRDRRAAKKLMKKYEIVIEDDSIGTGKDREFRVWVDQPEWLEGEDPLQDGHLARDWTEVLWLVSFYAKHRSDHPEYAERAFLEISPHS